jgi:hypothetical protein
MSQFDSQEVGMVGPTINDFLPAEMRKFAEQCVEQAKRAFEELVAATQRTITAFEGQSSSAQANAREIQRKVITYSERNIAASLEFARNLLSAKSPESVMALHAENM